MPSQVSRKEGQTYANQGVMDSFTKSSLTINSSITVGDKVTIFDCPGHWSWQVHSLYKQLMVRW